MSSGSTLNYSLPYPLQTDPVDVAADMQSLAVAVDTQLALTAPLLSPTFTGTPLSVTPNPSDNSTKIATTAYVKAQGYLTTSSASSTFATIANPTFTGVPSAPTAAAATNTTQIATTAFAVGEVGTHSSLTTGVHGVGAGSVVGTTLTQTLINKTMDGTLNTFQNIPQSAVTGLSGSYAPLNVAISVKTADYTLVLTDAASQIEMNLGSANTLYIPTDASANFPIGTAIIIVQTGAGQTTIAAVTPGTTTVVGTPGLKLRAQWSVATIIKRASNSWIVSGDVTS